MGREAEETNWKLASEKAEVESVRKAEVESARKATEAEVEKKLEAERAKVSKVESARKQAEQARLRAEYKAPRNTKRAEELAQRVEVLQRKLAEPPIPAPADPFTDPMGLSEYAYHMAFADGMRTLRQSTWAQDSVVLEEHLKEYATDPDHTVPSTFTLQFRDLKTKYGIDLSWFPRPEQLVDLPEEEEPTASEPTILTTTEGDLAELVEGTSGEAQGVRDAPSEATEG